MKKSARTADGGQPLGAQTFGAPSGIGPIRLVGQRVRRLVRPRPLEAPANEATAPRRGGERPAITHRSPMDAGVTGGMSLLFGAVDGERR